MNEPGDEFRRAAGQKERGLIAAFVAFMAENRMWWLTPILVVFLLMGIVFGATGVAPFLYPFVG